MANNSKLSINFLWTIFFISSSQASAPPNILLIVADDLGKGNRTANTNKIKDRIKIDKVFNIVMFKHW